MLADQLCSLSSTRLFLDGFGLDGDHFDAEQHESINSLAGWNHDTELITVVNDQNDRGTQAIPNVGSALHDAVERGGLAGIVRTEEHLPNRLLEVTLWGGECGRVVAVVSELCSATML